MKGFKKKLTSLLLACTSIMACVLTACEQKETDFGAAFTVYYGDTFAMPFAGTVTDSQGKSVKLNGGAFQALDIDGYSIQSNGKSYKVEVVKNKPITVTTEFDERYVVFQSGKVNFPKVNANGAIGNVTKEYRLYKNNESYYYTNDSFIPDQTGDYELQIKCIDEMGNSASKSVTYHVIEESDSNANAIAVFDAPSGKNHLANLYGLTPPEFTEEKAYGGERGSTKVQISSENNFMQSFQFVNLFDADVSDDLGVYFNIYNEGTQIITIYVNWAYSFHLYPNQWNEIYLDNIDESQWSNNELFADYITSENINGLYFETYYDAQGGDCANLYFSNMYKIPLYSADRFNRIIEDADITEDTEAHYKSIVRAYHQFSTLEKKQINGFSEKVEEKLWKYYEEKYDTVYTMDKLVDFNSKQYSEQVNVKGGLVIYDETATPAPNAKAGETGVTKIIANKNTYTLSVELTMPTTSRYSSAEQDADLNYLYNGYNFSIYCPELEGYDVYCSTSGEYTALEQGQWNEIAHKHGDKALRGNTIELYLAKRVAWDSPFPVGTEFKISSIYGKLKPTATMLNGYLESLAKMTDSQILTSELSQLAFEAYRMMNYDARNGVVGYKEFVERFSLALIPKTERIAGVGYAFNTKKGLQQISARDCIVSYTTEKKHGVNNGSLFVKPDEKRDPWSLYVELNAPTNVVYSPAYCYVWVEGSAESYQCSLSHPLDNSMYAKTRTVLEKGAWTKLYIPTTTYGLIGCSLMLATEDWAKRIPDDTKFYISPIYFEDYLDDELPLDENELPFVK